MIDCSWDNPGIDPARGRDVQQMISAYNYPKSDLQELVEKIKTANNDAVLIITKNGSVGIGGKVEYFGDMHFKSGKCNGIVNTSKWAFSREEKALVYCSVNNYCVAVPIICGNITKLIWKRNETENTLPKYYPDTKVNHVPITSTLFLVLIGLICAGSAIGRRQGT